MNKFIASLVAGLFLLFFSIPAFAQQPNSIPEKNGDYPDPEHPGVRVRVFVHEAGRPQALTAACTDGLSDAIVGQTGWHLSPAVTYKLNTASVPSTVGSGNLGTIAQNAFAQWSSNANGKVTFTEGTTSANRQSYDGQNIVAWGRTSGTALAVTYTRYYSSNGLVVDVDTIMNQKFPWSWNGGNANVCPTNNAYDAQDILTHELGHWMGLDDEYSPAYTDNTMFGYGDRNEVKKDTLTNGDISAVKTIYPK